MAQHPVIEISRIMSPNETSICIDQRNPSNILAGANINQLSRSNDGGLTWKSSFQYSPYGVWGDPVIIQDTSGSFYHFHLSNYDGGTWIDRLICQRSDDGGVSFNQGSYFGLNGTKAQDKPWAVVNPWNNEIYVTWTQFDEYDSKAPEDRSNILFSRSADKGETWSEPVRINSVDGNCLDDDDTVEGAVPAVGPAGEIYVSWSGPNGLVFNSSLDGGLTWKNEEIRISDHIGGWNIEIEGIYRANGMPVTKCDLSGGENHGTIYVNWADQRNGENNTDIFLTKSVDGGSSWSEPKRVNQDQGEAHQFFTWMDIDQTNGNLWFIYHDRRNADSLATDVFIAMSSDGGETFVEHKLSETSFQPEKEVFFGDYNNIAAHNNVIRPIWTRLDSKSLSIKTAIINPYLFTQPTSKDLVAKMDQKGVNLEIHYPRKLEEFDLTITSIDGEDRVNISGLSLKKGRVKIPLTNLLDNGIYTIVVTTGEQEIKTLWIKG